MKCRLRKMGALAPVYKCWKWVLPSDYLCLLGRQLYAEQRRVIMPIRPGLGEQHVFLNRPSPFYDADLFHNPPFPRPCPVQATPGLKRRARPFPGWITIDGRREIVLSEYVRLTVPIKLFLSPCESSPMSTGFSPGNPATISGRRPDLGQWLCAPSFQMVCLFQSTTM